MKQRITFCLSTLLLIIFSSKLWAQYPQHNQSPAAINFDITTVNTFDERVILIYNLMDDSRFDVVPSEDDGIFVISANDAYEGLDLNEAFADFLVTNADQFARLSKEEASEMAGEYKAALPMEYTLSLMMDIYGRSRQNNTCANADPFCTDNGMYQFPAGVNAGSGESGPYYDCLYSTPNPAWYYMRILNPGSIDIYMYSTPDYTLSQRFDFQQSGQLQLLHQCYGALHDSLQFADGRVLYPCDHQLLEPTLQHQLQQGGRQRHHRLWHPAPIGRQ